MEILWLFFAHFVADFLLQGREMGKNKADNVGWLALHCRIVFFVTLFASFVAFNTGKAVILFALANTAVHALIDKTVWNLYRYRHMKSIRKIDYWEDKWFYTTIGFDQTLHFATIVALFTLFDLSIINASKLGLFI